MSLQNKSSDNNEIIKKQKRSWLIVTILISVCCIAMFICVICCFASKESSLGISSLIIFILSLIVAVYFICIYKNRKDKDWLKDYGVVDSSFVVSKSINIKTSSLFATKLLIDNQNRKFIYQKGRNSSKVYSFSDIVNYEVYENGNSKVKGTAGKAIIGGAFFGLGGLIVGSSMGRNVNEKCNQLKLIIRLNDFSCPQIVITYIDNINLDKNSLSYRNMKENLQSLCSNLEYMMNEKGTIVNKQENISNDKSDKEQLQELKEMLDDGLITQEDFEQKKKQILGL